MRVIAAACAVTSLICLVFGADDWQAKYAPWRNRESITLAEWYDSIPPPSATEPSVSQFADMKDEARQELFLNCINRQADKIGKATTDYRSPDLDEVRQNVSKTLAERGQTVAVGVFWGRLRYVSILWHYLERNLRENGGIISSLLLITHNRDTAAGHEGADTILQAGVKKYPNTVKEVPFCPKPYGCAFDFIMNDTSTVYVKLDDDIVFIKDGSLEHLVFQILYNREYTFFSGSIVNNPHGIAVHQFVGAYPPVSYHWKTLGSSSGPPFVNTSKAGEIYYGKNVYDTVGSKAHESFIYNVAMGRLDVYTFDLWNMHACRCGKPQLGLDMCVEGYYRWSINAFAWTRSRIAKQKRLVPSFDEPEIGIGWTSANAPHRIGMVGESLFVHCQYTRQRASKPDFGLREVILLPWYSELARQYCGVPFGKWQGNATLFTLYEDMAYSWGEDRFSRSPKSRRPLCDDGKPCPDAGF